MDFHFSTLVREDRSKWSYTQAVRSDERGQPPRSARNSAKVQLTKQWQYRGRKTPFWEGVEVPQPYQSVAVLHAFVYGTIQEDRDGKYCFDAVSIWGAHYGKG
jgi:hypothetical protein